MTGWDYDRTVHRTGQHTGAWPTDKQCPGETIREWVARLDVQENIRLGSAPK